MKYSFNLKIETRLKEEGSNALTLTNRHSFALKTTMFGESIDAIWMNLGTFVNDIKVADSLKDVKADIPEIKQYIESAFENKIEVNFSVAGAKFGRFYNHTLGDYDDSALSALDGKTLKELDSSEEEG